MPKKFKDYYDKETAHILAEKLIRLNPDFDAKGFVSFIDKGVEGKEFLARQDVFVNGFEKYMGSDYTKNIELFTKILGPELLTETGMFTEGYRLWPIGRYVERNGTQNFDISLKFIHQLTKRFTGEFAIRPLIQSQPKKATKIILGWSKDDNVHVRRLASESMRISLPWAKKSLACIDEFSIYKQILTNLKSDPSKFVQKSVGNNLNDLYKLYPDKATEIIEEWQSVTVTKQTQWIINHGIRSTKKAK
jgi:3-methyladenine DNA glycosylase AlkC